MNQIQIDFKLYTDIFFRGEDSNEVYTKKQSLAEILYITILPFLEHIHNVLLIPPKVKNTLIFTKI